MERDKSEWMRADFNGLFSQLLCLSHDDFCLDFEDNRVDLKAGMVLTVFDENYERDQRDDLFVSGVVEPTPSGCCAGAHDGH